MDSSAGGLRTVEKKEIIQKTKNIVDQVGDLESKLKGICLLLHNNMDGYDWVGFYLVEEGELVLGPYIGEPTEHTNIEFGEGICGQAVEKEESFLVDDVDREENYLSCSPKVKSEIVVPIFKEGEVVGEIDIDSHEVERFTEEDEEMLEKMAEIIGKIL